MLSLPGMKSSQKLQDRQKVPSSFTSQRFALQCLLLATLALQACSFSANTKSLQQASSLASDHVSEQASRHSSAGGQYKHKQILATLKKQFEFWQGTAYRWGGNDRSGIDCSGLVMQIFQQEFNRVLPRTTAKQKRQGRSIRQSDLIAGDLVFFKTGVNLGHVGIYLQNQQFLHVSTRRGVMVSSLDNRYWRSRYVTARRVL